MMLTKRRIRELARKYREHAQRSEHICSMQIHPDLRVQYRDWADDYAHTAEALELLHGLITAAEDTDAR